MSTSHMSEIKTFVFLDLETTGLPHFENYTTKITELCAVAVQADHITECVPRVYNKLNLCFNPKKEINDKAAKISGLSNKLLEYQSSFSNDTVDVINKWLALNQKPLCLVAHNGNGFDYPILRAEIEKTGSSLPEELMCIDSLLAFKNMDKDKRVSYKLEEVYRRLTSKDPIDTHEAEGDVKTLITCAASYGCQFTAYANKNSMKFCDIKPMGCS